MTETLGVVFELDPQRMNILPNGVVIFGDRSARPIFHARKRRDIWPPCILEIAAPVEYKLERDFVTNEEGVKRKTLSVGAFASQLRNRWVKTRRRCRTCKKRINKIDIPLNLSPAHPHYEWFMSELRSQTQTLGQLDTLKEASEDDTGD
jgi:hypothetical protein